MKKIFKTCLECCGYSEEFSDCCDDYSENNKCNSCGKFCSTHDCNECKGQGGYWLEVGQLGTILTNILTTDYPKDLILHIKRTGHTTPDGIYPHYYHNDVKIVEIIDENTLMVVIGEKGRKKFKIKVYDFYL